MNKRSVIISVLALALVLSFAIAGSALAYSTAKAAPTLSGATATGSQYGGYKVTVMWDTKGAKPDEVYFDYYDLMSKTHRVKSWKPTSAQLTAGSMVIYCAQNEVPYSAYVCNRYGSSAVWKFQLI